jgi:hypothetical protein
MDTSTVIIAIVVIAIIIEAVVIVVCSTIWYRRGVSAGKTIVIAKMFTERGTRVHAKVTDVDIKAPQRQYTVKARWYDNETGNTHKFIKTFNFPEGAPSRFRPSINNVDGMVYVQAVLQPLYHMEQHW